MLVQLPPRNGSYTDRTNPADLIPPDLVDQDESMIAVEKLLRIALFSDELPTTTEPSLTDQRKKVTGTIRGFRKKCV